jgi:hypothetical protein
MSHNSKRTTKGTQQSAREKNQRSNKKTRAKKSPARALDVASLKGVAGGVDIGRAVDRFVGGGPSYTGQHAAGQVYNYDGHYAAGGRNTNGTTTPAGGNQQWGTSHWTPPNNHYDPKGGLTGKR